MLSGRSAGLGEADARDAPGITCITTATACDWKAAVLHDLLRSCQGGLAKAELSPGCLDAPGVPCETLSLKAFAWHAAKALPAQLGVLPPLAAKD